MRYVAAATLARSADGGAAVGLVLLAMTTPFFTATLAARSAYAPPQARAQVFVSMSALKVAAAALGTALAGALVGLGPRLLLLAGAAMVLAVVGAMVLDRRADPGRRTEVSRW